MMIDEMTFVGLHDRHSQAGEVQDGEGQDEQQTLDSFGLSKVTGLKLEGARFMISKALFDPEARSVL
jgi:hypothetical protein